VIASVLRWLSRRSLGLLHAFGGALGWAAYALSPTYRRRLLAHAGQAGVTAAQRRAAVTQAGRMVAELPRLWMRPAGETVVPPVQWQGAERIDAALDAGRGLLLMTPHLGCFEVCAQAYAERWGARVPVTVMFRPARKPWLRELVEASRTRPGMSAAPASLAGVRQMMRALKRGDAVGLLPDQVPPEGMGVWAPFFGRDAYTMTLAARLAEQTGATVLLMVGERLPAAAGWRVHVQPLPEPLPPGSPADEAHQVACATVINRAMEHLIRQWPHQYLWGYQRYKSPRRVRAEVAVAP
jgi:KDO2-lipid IV(A) lauroyltransferase